MKDQKGRISIAVIGCGRVSRTAHYDAIKHDDRYNFRAVCDIDMERAEEWGSKNGVNSYQHVKSLLESEKLDLVTINTPNGSHFQIAQTCLRHGVNVIVEKPLAMTTAEVDELIRISESTGLKVFNVLQNRYNSTNQLLKKAVEDGRFGRISAVNVNVAWRRTKAYYVEDGGWRADPRQAGGVFTNQCIHYIDMVLWLLNSVPNAVFASLGTAGYPVEVEDFGSAVVRFRSGAIATFTLTNLAYPGDIEGAVTIVGERGYAKLGGVAMNKVIEWNFADPSEDDKLIYQAESAPPTVYGFGHKEFYRRVADRLLGNERNGIIDAREGRKSVHLLEAIYRSAAEDKLIRF